MIDKKVIIIHRSYIFDDIDCIIAFRITLNFIFKKLKINLISLSSNLVAGKHMITPFFSPMSPMNKVKY